MECGEVEKLLAICEKIGPVFNHEWILEEMYFALALYFEVDRNFILRSALAFVYNGL